MDRIDPFYIYEPRFSFGDDFMDFGVFDPQALADLPEITEEEPPTLSQPHAFQLVQAEGGLCVAQGTVNSVIPTISGTELAANFTDNSLSLPGTGTREYWLKVTLDANGNITTVTIETTEPGADSATQAKLLLGSVETDSGNIVAFNSNLSGSQALASCGSTHYFGVV